jgi:site-specific recombinase XerD
MSSSRIYFKLDGVFDRNTAKLRDSSLSQDNKDLILKWQCHLFSGKASRQRVAKLTLQMRRFCEDLKKDLDKITKDDLEQKIAKINQDQKLSEATKADYRRLIKQFYKWFKNEDRRLEEIDFDMPKEEIKKMQQIKKETLKLYSYIETSIKSAFKKKEIDPADVINEDELRVILEKGCNNIKDKAFISLLHETGCRIGEFLEIKLKDIIVKPNFIEIYVDGKTGRRTVYSYSSMPYLIEYINSHPYKDNQNSYLWLCIDNHNKGKEFRHIGAVRLLKRCIERSGLKKRINPHWFRHCRASLLASKVTEPVLRKIMGWSKASNMIKHYGHLSQKDVENVICNVNGIESEKTDQIRHEPPIRCSVCGTMNPNHETYCIRCSRPLKVETMIKEQEMVNNEIGKTVRVMMEMMKNPAMMKKFEEFKNIT